MNLSAVRTKSTACTLGPILLLLVSFVFLYREVVARLVHDWYIDENYSHGFLIVPLALVFVWERRETLAAAKCRTSTLGLALVLFSICTLVAGTLGSELFLTRVSMVGVIAGSVLFILGWEHLRILILPTLFLLLMIPIPAIIFNQVAFPLQLFASHFGELSLAAFGIPILREGNLIHLANTTLEVAEACSGIRSMISLLTLGIVYGYYMESRIWIRTLLALATVPIAIVANGMRIAGTGITAHHYSAEAAEGFLHGFSGWLIFVVAFAMLFIFHRVLKIALPGRSRNTHPIGEADRDH